MSRAPVAIAASTLLCALSLSSAGAKDRAAPVTVKLAFAPSESLHASQPDLGTAMLGRPIHVLAFEDRRVMADAHVIGRDGERDGSVEIRTDDDVVGLVNRAIREMLDTWSLRDEPAADLKLAGELLLVNVDRQHGARAQVQAQIRLLDRQNRPIWEGVVAGQARSFGRSSRAATCNEVLSDALIDMLRRTLEHRGLQTAWESPEQAAQELAAGTTPRTLLPEVVNLLNAGVDAEIVASYLKRMTLRAPFTADDRAEWKKFHVPDVVVQAALDLPAPVVRP